MQNPELTSDCTQCFGLCCIVLPYSASAGFGVDKPGGVPCLNLADDDRCRIHATLRDDGWSGCTVFECLGAGQQVSQVTYGGTSWRHPDSPPHLLAEMGAVLSVMRQLHEMLVHLREADARGHQDAAALTDHIRTLTQGSPEALLTLDLDELYDDVAPVLGEVSATARANWPDAHDLGQHDLAGRDLRERDLRGAALRGAVLIQTDLRGLDLTDADLLGADCRDADVRGSDLRGALHLTQVQINTMRGDRATRLPAGVDRPSYW